jgi:hypothetical protein
MARHRTLGPQDRIGSLCPGKQAEPADGEPVGVDPRVNLKAV